MIGQGSGEFDRDKEIKLPVVLAAVGGAIALVRALSGALLMKMGVGSDSFGPNDWLLIVLLFVFPGVLALLCSGMVRVRPLPAAIGLLLATAALLFSTIFADAMGITAGTVLLIAAWLTLRVWVLGRVEQEGR